jgi:hypothetical protein
VQAKKSFAQSLVLPQRNIMSILWLQGEVIWTIGRFPVNIIAEVGQ